MTSRNGFLLQGRKKISKSLRIRKRSVLDRKKYDISTIDGSLEKVKTSQSVGSPSQKIKNSRWNGSCFKIDLEFRQANFEFWFGHQIETKSESKFKSQIKITSKSELRFNFKLQSESKSLELRYSEIAVQKWHAGFAPRIIIFCVRNAICNRVIPKSSVAQRYHLGTAWRSSRHQGETCWKN